MASLRHFICCCGVASKHPSSYTGMTIHHCNPFAMSPIYPPCPSPPICSEAWFLNSSCSTWNHSSKLPTLKTTLSRSFSSTMDCALELKVDAPKFWIFALAMLEKQLFCSDVLYYLCSWESSVDLLAGRNGGSKVALFLCCVGMMWE